MVAKDVELGGVPRRIVVAGALALAVMGLARAAVAQVATVATQPVERSATESQRVSVDIENLPLTTALMMIAREAGLNPAFNRSLIPVEARVTLHAREELVSSVFAQALRGTGLAARIHRSGDVFIGRSEVLQATGTVIGKVTHGKTGQGIALVTVTADDASQGVATDDEGTFRMSVPAGEHKIRVRGVGFVRQTKQTSVPEGGIVTLNFALDPSTSVLDEVVVTGTVVATERKAIPTPITVISAEDIEKRGITRIDQLFRGEVPGVIALDLGVSTYNDASLGGMASSRVYSRGSASLDGGANPIKTYVDGVELFDSKYLGTIDPKSIERIEIITGPQAATIYGSGAMGGVMQIFTKKGLGHRAPDATLNLRYGMLENNMSGGHTPSHNHSLLISGGSGPDFNYSANASYNYIGQWQPKLFSRSAGAQFGANYVYRALTIGGNIALTSGLNGTSGVGTFSIGVVGGTLMDKLKQQEGEWIPRVSAWYPQRRSSTFSQTNALNLDYRASSIWQHHVTVGRTQTNLALEPMQPAFASISDSLLKTSSTTGQRTTLSYNMTIVPRFGPVASSLTLGANGSSGDQLDVVGSLASKETTTLSVQYATKTTYDQTWGGFANWQLGFFDHLYVTLGLRGERSPLYGSKHRVDWTPTNGVAYTFELGDLTIKALGSYGRSTRLPAADARRALYDGNPDYSPSTYAYQLESPTLRPERSQGPQGGLEIYYGNLGSLTVNHYQQTVTDLLQWFIVDSIEVTEIATSLQSYWPQYQWNNTAKMRQRGWEGTGSLNVGDLTFKGTYSWNDTRVLAVNPLALYYAVAAKPGQSLKGIPTHSGNFTVTYARGNTSASLITNYIGAMPMDWSYSIRYQQRSYGRLKMYADRSLTLSDSYRKSGYMKSDFVATHRLTPWASATLNVTNLANRFTGDTYGDLFPTLGRQTLLGVSLKYSGR